MVEEKDGEDDQPREGGEKMKKKKEGEREQEERKAQYGDQGAVDLLRDSKSEEARFITDGILRKEKNVLSVSHLTVSQDEDLKKCEKRR